MWSPHRRWGRALTLGPRIALLLSSLPASSSHVLGPLGTTSSTPPSPTSFVSVELGGTAVLPCDHPGPPHSLATTTKCRLNLLRPGTWEMTILVAGSDVNSTARGFNSTHCVCDMPKADAEASVDVFFIHKVVPRQEDGREVGTGRKLARAGTGTKDRKGGNGDEELAMAGTGTKDRKGGNGDASLAMAGTGTKDVGNGDEELVVMNGGNGDEELLMKGGNGDEEKEIMSDTRAGSVQYHALWTTSLSQRPYLWYVDHGELLVSTHGAMPANARVSMEAALPSANARVSMEAALPSTEVGSADGGQHAAADRAEERLLQGGRIVLLDKVPLPGAPGSAMSIPFPMKKLPTSLEQLPVTVTLEFDDDAAPHKTISLTRQLFLSRVPAPAPDYPGSIVQVDYSRKSLLINGLSFGAGVGYYDSQSIGLRNFTRQADAGLSWGMRYLTSNDPSSGIQFFTSNEDANIFLSTTA